MAAGVRVRVIKVLLIALSMAKGVMVMAEVMTLAVAVSALWCKEKRSAGSPAKRVLREANSENRAYERVQEIGSSLPRSPLSVATAPAHHPDNHPHNHRPPPPSTRLHPRASFSQSSPSADVHPSIGLGGVRAPTVAPPLAAAPSERSFVDAPLSDALSHTPSAAPRRPHDRGGVRGALLKALLPSTPRRAAQLDSSSETCEISKMRSPFHLQSHFPNDAFSTPSRRPTPLTPPQAPPLPPTKGAPMRPRAPSLSLSSARAQRSEAAACGVGCSLSGSSLSQRRRSASTVRNSKSSRPHPVHEPSAVSADISCS
eukprot:4760472-Pleurochrysis_carterae.AAC.2